MVGFVSYPRDNRVRREAEALAAAGARVEVLCLRGPGEARTEEVDGVRVERFGVPRTRGSRLRYLAEYGLFAVRVFLRLARQGRGRYDVIHVHNPPDLLVLCALVPRLRGTRVVLDIHDVMPELYQRRYGLGERAPGVRLLRRAERLAARLADHVLVASPLMRERLVARSVSPERCTTILNLPDPRFFPPDGPPARGSGDRLRVVFPGTLAEVQGVDLAIRAVHRVRSETDIPIELHIYGAGAERYVTGLRALVRELGLDGAVVFHAPVTGEAYAQVLRSMDAGVVPKRAGVFADLALSTKLMDFAAVGLPAVVARTTPETLFFDDRMVVYFEPGDPESLAQGLIALYRDPARRARLAANARRIVARLNWAGECARLLEVYAGLCGHPSTADGRLSSSAVEARRGGG